MYQLSQKQIDDFHRDGYLHIPIKEHNLFTAETIQSYTSEVKEWPEEKGKWMPYLEMNLKGEQQLLRTECFADYHPGFDQLLREGSLPSILQQLSGSQMLLFKDKINYKAPNGNGFKAHLDAPAYDHICKVEHLTINIAVDDATVENGCLEVVPASHKMKVGMIGNNIDPNWEKEAEWKLMPLCAGDLFIFGSHLAHRSAANRSSKGRASVYATFNSILDGKDMHEKYYAHRRVAFPPDHERIVGKDYSEGYKRYGFAAPFISVKN